MEKEPVCKLQNGLFFQLKTGLGMARLCIICWSQIRDGCSSSNGNAENGSQSPLIHLVPALAHTRCCSPIFKGRGYIQIERDFYVMFSEKILSSPTPLTITMWLEQIILFHLFYFCLSWSRKSIQTLIASAALVYNSGSLSFLHIRIILEVSKL